MPDIYSRIGEADPEVQSRLAEVIEMRAADPRQKAMLHAYLSEVHFGPGSRVLEIGCGTGPVTRVLAGWPGVANAVGIDPSPVFIERARVLAQAIPNVTFERGDGRELPFERDEFDAVVVHTTLSHVPNPEALLAEAFRVLRPGGSMTVFDGDYATATVATGPNDPLEACIEAFRQNFVHDSWLIRRLPRLLRASGFTSSPMQSHGYVESLQGAYMMTWVERGADVLLQEGRISPNTAAALKAEAKSRSDAQVWFGHIAFASVVSRKST